MQLQKSSYTRCLHRIMGILSSNQFFEKAEPRSGSDHEHYESCHLGITERPVPALALLSCSAYRTADAVHPLCHILPFQLDLSLLSSRPSIKLSPIRKTTSTSAQNSCRHLEHLRPTARSRLPGNNPFVCPLLVCSR